MVSTDLLRMIDLYQIIYSLSKKFPVLLFLAFLPINFSIANNNPANENESIKVSLLTVSPGSDLYSIFGHSSIRIQNIKNGTDWVYNYGTFDFDAPNFYLNFAKGNLAYSLSRLPFNYAKQQIILEDRNLIETPLMLDAAERTTLFRYLEENYLPENRNYTYDFLFNNCATRIFDLIKMSINEPLLINKEAMPKGSFRKLIHPYFKNQRFTRMGVDILMGAKVDLKVRDEQASFLPDYLHLLFKNTLIKHNTLSAPLTSADFIHVRQSNSNPKLNLSPSYFLWTLALIILILFFRKNQPTYLKYFDSGLFLLNGILGSLIVFLWVATDIPIYSYNTDILWSNPLFLVIAFIPLKTLKRNTVLWNVFFILLSTLITLGIVAAFFIEDNQDIAALAIIILLRVLYKLVQIRN